MTKVGNTVTVKIPIFLRDISDYLRQLDFPHEFSEYNISLQIVDQIYYNATDMGVITQTIKSAILYTDVCYLDEKKIKLIILKILINLIKLFLFLIIM